MHIKKLFKMITNTLIIFPYNSMISIDIIVFITQCFAFNNQQVTIRGICLTKQVIYVCSPALSYTQLPMHVSHIACFADYARVLLYIGSKFLFLELLKER